MKGQQRDQEGLQGDIRALDPSPDQGEDKEGVQKTEASTLTLPATLGKGKQREAPTPRHPGSCPGLPPPLAFKEIHSCHLPPASSAAPGRNLLELH